MAITKNHVSNRLRAEATASIDAKRNLLAKWARKGIPRRAPARAGADAEQPLLEWFPTSLRTFCAWDGTQNAKSLLPELQGVRRNAYQTLVADEKRLQDVQALLKALAKQATVASSRDDPKRRVKEVEQRIKLEREKRAGALLGYRQARQQLRKAQLALAAEQRAHQGSIEQLERQMAAQDAEVVELRRKVAELTASIHKTTPMRRVR